VRPPVRAWPSMTGSAHGPPVTMPCG